MPKQQKKKARPLRWHDTTVVSTLHAPASLRPFTPRGVYCALLGHAFEKKFKKDTYVFIAYDPILATIKHNSRTLFNKETRSVAPFWQLHVAIGPFKTVKSATACGQELVNCTRGCLSKRKRAFDLAVRYGVSCYSDQVQAPGGAEEYLRQHAPAQYVALLG